MMKRVIIGLCTLLVLVSAQDEPQTEENGGIFQRVEKFIQSLKEPLILSENNVEEPVEMRNASFEFVRADGTTESKSSLCLL